MSAGYSATPLPRKLGLKAPMQVVVLGAPADYTAIVGELPAGVVLGGSPTATTDMVHLFATRRAALAEQLAALRRTLGDEAAVWVSWPKKAAKVETDVTEDTVRALALPLGFVDVKVCAVTEVWSGLKLVVRKALRTQDR
jgi:hypothetical protein